MKIKAVKRSLIILILLFFISFLLSCGLPVYNIMYPPVNAGSPAEAPEERFFSFKTADNLNNQYANEIYRGVGVYYRIYNNENDCNSDVANIKSVNADFSHNGFNKMQSLGYKEMRATPALHNQAGPLFEPSVLDYTITIRLFTEGIEDYTFEAGFTRDSLPFPSNSLPIRSNGGSFKFNEDPPNKGDSDYKHNEEADEEFYYVSAFAVSLGRDGSFQPFYSSLLSLGIIKIPKAPNY